MIGTAPHPLVSVVTCTRGRAALLRSTLQSLLEQTLGRDAFEVVVVDDGSEADTRAIAREFEPGLSLRWSGQRHAGIASARNHGVFLARGVILIFLDEGVAAEPELLERHLEAHRRFPEGRFAVVGRTRLDVSIADDPLMRFTIEACELPTGGARGRPGDLLPWSHFRAGRSSCKRAFLLYRGTFDAGFRSGGEDVELAYRLSRHGLRVVHEPGAVTRVLRRESIDEMCARMHHEGVADSRLSRIHDAPEVRAWTRVDTAAAEWSNIAPAYDAIVRSARELDRVARARAEIGMPLAGRDEELLHGSYRVALEVSRVKGLADGLRHRVAVDEASDEAP